MHSEGSEPPKPGGDASSAGGARTRRTGARRGASTYIESKRRAKRMRILEKALRELVAQGVAQKLFRPVDPKLTSFAVFGAINWITRWYKPGGETDPERIGEGFADLFLDGLRTGAR